MKIFVIMPFTSEFNFIYRYLIKQPLEQRGDYDVDRADDDPTHQNILEEIVQGISTAHLIIADLTHNNSNVYYELGFAHTLRLPTIHIVQDMHHVQFDLGAYNAILYSVKSDGTSDLTDRLIELIEKPGYKFSNPVNDYLNGEYREPIVFVDNADGSVESDAEESDDADYGILDARVDAHDALENIQTITVGIGEDIAEIAEKTEEHTERINDLQLNPDQKRLQSKVLQVMQKFASDINAFSDSIDSRIPELRESWNRLDQGLGHELLTSDIESESDLEAVTEFISQLENMLGEQIKAIGSIQGFRDEHAKLIGLSKVSNQALRNLTTSLDKLTKELELGNSVVTRIINLAEAMIDRYNGNNSDNGNDPDNDNAA